MTILFVVNCSELVSSATKEVQCARLRRRNEYELALPLMIAAGPQGVRPRTSWANVMVPRNLPGLL
jgi:hypothetical protein